MDGWMDGWICVTGPQSNDTGANRKKKNDKA